MRSKQLLLVVGFATLGFVNLRYAGGEVARKEEAVLPINVPITIRVELPPPPPPPADNVPQFIALIKRNAEGDPAKALKMLHDDPSLAMARDVDGSPAIVLAAERNEEDLVRNILGASLNEAATLRDPASRTAAVAATERHFTNLLEPLIKAMKSRQAEGDIADALILSIERNDRACAEEIHKLDEKLLPKPLPRAQARYDLFELGAPFDTQWLLRHLRTVAKKDMAQIVGDYLDAGMNPSEFDADGFNVLMAATQSCNELVIKKIAVKLTKAQKDPVCKARNRFGETAAMMKIRYCNNGESYPCP